MRVILLRNFVPHSHWSLSFNYIACGTSTRLDALAYLRPSKISSYKQPRVFNQEMRNGLGGLMTVYLLINVRYFHAPNASYDSYTHVGKIKILVSSTGRNMIKCDKQNRDL